nr:unnamed protein product [Callosobruchus chinensis]
MVSNRPISVVELERRRLATATSLSRNLKNMVEFNASKTQYCTLSNKSITGNMIWHEHVLSTATAVGKKLGYLFRARKYFSHSNLLTLYKAHIRPSLENCSHIWGAAAPTTLSILDVVHRRVIRLIGDPALTCYLQPLSHRHAVGDLSLFYWYSNGFCSSELTSIIPPLCKPARCTSRSSYIKNRTIRPHLCPQGVQGLEWTTW